MKNRIKFIAGQGLGDALKIEDLCEAKEYLKDFADTLTLNHHYDNPFETAFMNILDKIKGKVVELDDSEYKV